MPTNGDPGKNLHAALARRNVTQQKLAEKLHVGPENVSRWISKNHVPRARVSEIERILTVKGLTAPHEEFLRTNFTDEYLYVTKLLLDEAHDAEFRQHMNRLLGGVNKFVYYTRLCDFARFDTDTHSAPYDLENEGFRTRVRQGRVQFHHVEIFYHPNRLEAALRNTKALASSGSYSCRYYLRPPQAVPVFAFRSWDHRHFLLGGYHLRRSPIPGEEFALIFEAHEPLTSFFVEYWREIWSNATPLWDRDLHNAEQVALTLMSPEEWKKMKNRL
ncbi:MAG: helix-turn-helix transcriptional regulator [Alphaproteobacteria bacterium]|nr:helix-turn-helix transcriptional regulator [Alphaproteobacteria bacterium]